MAVAGEAQTVQFNKWRTLGRPASGGSTYPAPQQTPLPLLSSLNRTGAPLFDESYLAALRARNAEVETHLVACFATPVRIKLRARLRSPELVEDAFQETFLRVFSHFRAGKTLNSPSSLPGFIHGVCHNTALQLLRENTRQDQLPENHPGPVDRGMDPQNQMITEERKEMVRRLLREMPEKDGRLLQRVFLDEEDKDVVCREFHIDRSYLRMLLFRARQRFRAAIDREAAHKPAFARS